MKGQQLGKIFLAGFLFTTFAFFLDMIAFITPFWVASIPDRHSQFVRIGLWTACFNGFVDPNDMATKAYYGCWYIYYQEFDAIRKWLNPDWFYACQVMATIGFVTHIIAVLIVAFQGCRMISKYTKKATLTTIVCHFLSGCCLTIIVIAIGVQSTDTRWMPYPENNRLSWSFAFAVLSLAGTIAAFITFCYMFIQVNYPKYRDAFRRPRQYKTQMHPLQPGQKIAGPYDPAGQQATSPI